MASLLEISPVLWRKRLRQASFKGAAFHVEQQGRASGRRTVLHEYPKRDMPYAEDMGLVARRYQVTGYVIQRWSPRQGASHGAMPFNYDLARDALIAALESEGPGRLVDPYSNRVGPEMYQCERYTMTETRERGGYAQFDMLFVEAGAAAFGAINTNSLQNIFNTAQNSTTAAARQLNRQLSALNKPTNLAFQSAQF